MTGHATLWGKDDGGGAHLFVLAAVLALGCVPAARAVAQDGSDAVTAKLDEWATAYSTATSPDEILSLYDPQSVFWGTGATQPFVGAEQIGPYFAQQFANFPERRVSFIDPVIRIYGDTATATGLYRFEVTTVDGTDYDVVHRFSFALHEGEQGWTIVHQHSSQLPRP